MATTTTTTTLNVVSLPISLAPATGNYSGPACIILNTTGSALSQVQQQHQQLLVNRHNEQDYHQAQHLQQHQHNQQRQLDLSNHHHNINNNNNNNNNININNIGTTTTNNGTVVGVVGVGELVGLVGVGAPVVNVPACPTSTAATVNTNGLAPTTSETSTSTTSVTLRLNADPPVSMPTVLRPVNPPAPITTNVTTSNVILNVSGVLNNHTTNTTTSTTNNNINNNNNNNNNNIKCYNNNIIHANDNNNNISYINNNLKKMKNNISKTTCSTGLAELSTQQLLQTLQQPYQQNQSQHGPELLRCKRRIDFSGLGFTLPRAQPAAVARRNERERNRVKLVNLGFEALREHVPNGRKNKKMSKVETLRAAVQYIKHLQEILHHEPDFLDISDLEMCAAAAVAQLTSATGLADPTVSTSVQHSKSISPPPNSDISCSPSSSLCSDSGSSCDTFLEDDLIDFSRLL